MSPAARASPFLAALGRLRPHDHVCSIYESQQEHFAVAVPFIKIGLHCGERCIYVADDGGEDTIREAMHVAGIDVESSLASKALILTTKEEAYLKHGSFDPDSMFAFWKEATGLAMSEGFTALRVSGESQWLLSGAPGLERWMEYESRLTHALAEINCLSLCQYDRRLFQPELILDVIRTHPSLIHRGKLCRNTNDLPAAEFLGTNQVAHEVERLLINTCAREQMEQALRRQRHELNDRERRVRLMLEGVKDSAIFLLDTQGRVISWNAGAERIKGYHEAEILGQHFSRFYVPEEIAAGKPEEQLRIASATGRSEDEGWRVRKDGTRFVAGVLITALRDDEGKLIGFCKLTRDITERKQAEEELRRSEAYLVEGQRISHTGSWAWSATSGELFWSLEHFRIFGLDPEKTKATREIAFQMMHPNDRTPTEQAFQRAVQERSEFSSDFRLVLADGTIRYIHSLGHPVYSASGELSEYVGTVLDLTERKRAEEALRTAEAELARVSRVTTMGELTASIAHEVNQPLAAVVTNANACLRWLAGATPNLAEVRDALERIIRDGNRASDVIARIRALLRKAATEKERLDLNEAIQEAIALAQGELRKNGVVLRTALASDLPPVLGDRVQLQQVLLNLIMNGIEAMSALADRPKELSISAQKVELDLQVLVTVQDSGVGLNRQDMENLFKAFYTTKPQGMGIGLSISRTIVEAHGGLLWAAPSDGSGATFQFTLPIHDASAV
jgi:PAS domain S-box-containing protein